ncbi:MAG TPA: DNA polymerase III subunit gamma/tau [Ilumatobacteraceae bacterium]|jgi:DNA polymerase III subunit gamma/tau|nr:DNA polymerase III subunit gamma/tau [Ilumatobacteraceae bacterium]
MATQSLYRRYRPRRFSELRGQEHVVRALRNAVMNEREGQAYLFSGPRGTGKTSSARILAKVLNCERPVDGEPCCECDSCLAVERGTSYDVHELDAASNNGVDAMRDLIEKASLGTPGRHKVYILDEVHMLSKAAEAALLKTLEEPPPHVVFVLATTDPQKVSETIRSRTQHLQFHLLPMDVLEQHIRWLAADAEIELSDAALEGVLRQGGGSARDTISALELVANSGGEAPEVIPLDEFVEAFIEHDPGRALAVVAHAVLQGSDPRTLTEEIIRHLRDCFLALMAPELVQLPADREHEVSSQATRLGAAAIVRSMERLGEMLVEMRHAPDPRLLLEVALVQLTNDAAGSDLHSLMSRLERLEQTVAEGATAPAAKAIPTDASGRATIGGRARRETAPTTPASPSASAPASAPGDRHPSQTGAPKPTAASTPTGIDDVGIPALFESQVRPALRGMAKAIYMGAQVGTMSDGMLLISFAGEPHRVRAEEYRHEVERALAAAAGRSVPLSLVVDQATAHDDNVVQLKRTPQPAADEDVDTGDLVDVPPDAVISPIDRLAQAFPGSEIIEERT